MKLIYSHQNSMMVGLIKSKLESEGLEVILKNDMISGGAGELAPMDLWPELWLIHESDYKKATTIISSMASDEKTEQWHCSLCGENNDISFEICWRCQSIPPLDFGIL